ncbi:M24 family metallopeptidase [Xanthomonas sp. Kuri4-2]
MKKLTGIGAAEYARRRRQLMQMAGDQAILVLPAAPERVRSHDTHYPYRQDSDFWYLSGFPEPEAVLVLIPGRRHGEAILFCRERDPEREAWDGAREGQDGAVERYGMDDAYPIDDLDEILPGLLEGRSRVYHHFGREVDFDLKLIAWVDRVRAQGPSGAQPPHEFLELGHLLHEQRLFKSRDEIALMQRAADISVQAHRVAMRAARPGIHEYELQADLEREFRAHDAWPAYASIVGSGANGCILHYRANHARSRDGELVLWESNTICRYLAAQAGRDDLLPAVPAQRARVEQWMDWQATELNTAWRYAFMARVRRSPAHADPAAIEAGVQQWNRHMAILDAQLQQTGAFVAGADFTLADIVVGLSTQRWYASPIERPALPAVADYYARLGTRPGFQRHGCNGLP